MSTNPFLMQNFQGGFAPPRVTPATVGSVPTVNGQLSKDASQQMNFNYINGSMPVPGQETFIREAGSFSIPNVSSPDRLTNGSQSVSSGAFTSSIPEICFPGQNGGSPANPAFQVSTQQVLQQQVIQQQVFQQQQQQRFQQAASQTQGVVPAMPIPNISSMSVSYSPVRASGVVGVMPRSTGVRYPKMGTVATYNPATGVRSGQITGSISVPLGRPQSQMGVGMSKLGTAPASMTGHFTTNGSLMHQGQQRMPSVCQSPSMNGLTPQFPASSSQTITLQQAQAQTQAQVQAQVQQQLLEQSQQQASQLSAYISAGFSGSNNANSCETSMGVSPIVHASRMQLQAQQTGAAASGNNPVMLSRVSQVQQQQHQRALSRSLDSVACRPHSDPVISLGGGAAAASGLNAQLSYNMNNGGASLGMPNHPVAALSSPMLHLTIPKSHSPAVVSSPSLSSSGLAQRPSSLTALGLQGSPSVASPIAARSVSAVSSSPQWGVCPEPGSAASLLNLLISAGVGDVSTTLAGADRFSCSAGSCGSRGSGCGSFDLQLVEALASTGSLGMGPMADNVTLNGFHSDVDPASGDARSPDSISPIEAIERLREMLAKASQSQEQGVADGDATHDLSSSLMGLSISSTSGMGNGVSSPATGTSMNSASALLNALQEGRKEGAINQEGLKRLTYHQEDTGVESGLRTSADIFASNNLYAFMNSNASHGGRDPSINASGSFGSNSNSRATAAAAAAARPHSMPVLSSASLHSPITLASLGSEGLMVLNTLAPNLNGVLAANSNGATTTLPADVIPELGDLVSQETRFNILRLFGAKLARQGIHLEDASRNGLLGVLSSQDLAVLQTAYRQEVEAVLVAQSQAGITANGNGGGNGRRTSTSDAVVAVPEDGNSSMVLLAQRLLAGDASPANVVAVQELLKQHGALPGVTNETSGNAAMSFPSLYNGASLEPDAMAQFLQKRLQEDRSIGNVGADGQTLSIKSAGSFTDRDGVKPRGDDSSRASSRLAMHNFSSSFASPLPLAAVESTSTYVAGKNHHVGSGRNSVYCSNESNVFFSAASNALQLGDAGAAIASANASNSSGLFVGDLTGIAFSPTVDKSMDNSSTAANACASATHSNPSDATDVDAVTVTVSSGIVGCQGSTSLGEASAAFYDVLQPVSIIPSLCGGVLNLKSPRATSMSNASLVLSGNNSICGATAADAGGGCDPEDLDFELSLDPNGAGALGLLSSIGIADL